MNDSGSDRWTNIRPDQKNKYWYNVTAIFDDTNDSANRDSFVF